MSWDGLSRAEQLYITYGPGGPPAPAPPLSDASKAIITGNDPTGALQDTTQGKDAPLFIGGQALIGGRIYSGPRLYTEADVNYCDMTVGYGIMATPGASRSIPYANLNGTKSIESSDGGLTWSPIGPALASIEVEARFGSEDQLPFAWEISEFGSKALAYRSHALLNIRKIPLAPFNNVVPFSSSFLHETDSISRTDALTKLARCCRFDDSEFWFDVEGTDAFWIAIQKATMMQYLQNLRATIGRNWNILTSDQLRVFENSAADGVTFNLTKANTAMDSIRLTRKGPEMVYQRRLLGFVDIERDNAFNTVPAEITRFPLPVMAPQDASTTELPIGMTSSDASFYLNRALLIDDLARKGLACTGLNALAGAEPGDITLREDDNGVSFLGRLTSLIRSGVAAGGTDMVFEQIDFSHLPNVAPHITSNGGGSTAAITIQENTTAVTTVTATDVNHDLLTFSISGGADAALFTINAATGELAFIDPPDYEAPADAGADNVYEVIVQVSDGGLTDSQTISVTVTDVFEGGGGVGTPSPEFLIIF